MASGKAAQHGRGGHRKVRRHSTPERINTARPDEEHLNVALEQVNALEELPASEVGFPFSDLPTVRRLYHEAYELTDGPAAVQAQMPFVQRPKCSAPLKKGECFTFGARQHQEINAQREKQPPIQRQSLLQQSSPRSQGTADGGKRSFVASVDETHSTVSANISNSIVENPQKFATTVTIDLTCASPSADMEINLGRNQIKDAESTAQQVFQAPSGSITREPQSGNLVTSAVDRIATPHTRNLREEAPSPTSFHSRSLENGGSAQSQKPSQNLHHPLHAMNARQLTSGPTYPPTAHLASTSSLVAVNKIRVSEKETQDCSGEEDFPNITPGRPPNNYHGPLSTLEIYPVPRMEPKDLEATLLPNSKEVENKDGLTKEAMKLRPHTPQSIARHLPEKPATVNKVLPNNQQVPQSAAPGFQGDTELPLVRAVSSGPVSSSRDAAPSEEDLFYLLMHRQRQRKDVEARLSARLKHLETVNTRLSKQNQTYRCQISASYISRDKSAAEARFQKEALENFKTRFQKLKTFVNGLGNDYSALRQHADQIQVSQQSLLNEKEDIYRDVQSCRAASAASEQSVYNIISNFAEVRQSIAPLEESLAEGRRTLEAESRLLLREQHKNKRLETYLVQVASTQNRYSSAIQDEQKAVLGQLREISAKVSAVEKATTVELQPLLLHNLDECVRMLTRIHDAERVGPADITKITHAVSSLSESFSSYRKSLSEGFQAAADAQVNSGKQLVSQIKAVHETLHATTIKEGQLASLREDKIRLEEQLKSSENVAREIREGRMSADSRESHLRATTDSLLKQLKTLQSQAIQAQKPSPPMDERDMIGTWRLKYTNISQALARSEEQVNARENELRQSEEKGRTLAVQLDAAQAEHNAAVQALNEANERVCAQAGAVSELQQKLADKGTSLEVLRLELRSTETKFCDEAEKVEELAGLCTKYENELKEVKSQLDAAIKESAKANKQVCELELRMIGFAEAQQEAAKVVQLTEELQNEQSKVAKLILEIEPLEKMAGEVPRLKQQLSEKQGAIDSLEARLGEAGAAAGQVRALKITVLQSAEDISRLQGELRNAQSRASWAAEKQEQFHKMTQDVAEFRKKVVDLECLADRVPGLQKEAQSHLQEVLRLQQELYKAKRSAEQLRDLEATNRHSCEEIKLLKMELHAANETLSRLQGVEDANDRKDQEARTLNERITIAEDNLTQAVIDKENHIATMKQELDAANESLKRLEEVECANGDKDKEIASLKEKLGAAESILKEVQIVKEESQQKEVELSVLRDRLARIEEESHRLSQTVPEKPSRDQNPSQETMAAFQEAITRHERGFQTDQAVVVPPVLDAAPQLKRKTCRNATFRNPQELQTRIGETIRVESTGMGTFSSNEAPESSNGDNLVQVMEWQNPRTQETRFIPESQPAMHSRHEKSPINAPSISSISSPLTDPHHELTCFGLQKVAKRSNTSSQDFPVTFKSSLQLPVMLHGDLPSSRPPSSSTGDTMLLEAEEEPKRIEEHDDKLSSDSWRQRLGPKGEANRPERLPPGQPEDIFGNGATKSSSKIAKFKSKGDVRITSKHASPLRRRSESRTRIKKATPLQERAPSDQNVPASPQGGVLREKHLPNSAAKRRFEDDEISLFPSSQEGSKRLKRKLSAAEIKSPSNRKGSSFPERVTPVTGAGRLNHPSMPTGSRKRSIIGTNAPAPGLGQHSSKKSKKAPKTDRYSARFNQDTT